MSDPSCSLSVIVPAFCEAPNIRPLCERVLAACARAGINAEMVIVDDNSQDGTQEAVAELAGQLPVTLVVRRDERGLSTAVLAGFNRARADCFLVMDADLQHPPEQVPDVARPVLEGRADICVGSRYVRDGRSAEDWPVHRRLNSWAATILARPLTPVRDCMAGFFAVRREVIDSCENLDPVGYKILLEILAKSPRARVEEIPIAFGLRNAGESKLTLRQQGQYLRHLYRLYQHRLPWVLPILAVAILTLLLVIAGLRN